MKYIDKKIKNEPKRVIEKRNTPGSSFDDLPKEPLRSALLNEQGFICAYCMQRIHNNSKSTKIEHFSPRKDKSEKGYLEFNKNYMNLLAVCKGNEGVKGKEHCDTLKDDKPISISPLEKSCEQLVKFDPNGKVYSLDEKIDKELNKKLGLNQLYLIEERRKILDAVKDEILKAAKNNTDKKVKRADLNAMLKDWEVLKKAIKIKIIDGKKRKFVQEKYEPFCQVAIEYLNKKLRRI